VEEINASGGVLGRKIQIVWEDDQGSVNEAKRIAHEFIQNLDMVAVIGHYHSYVSTSVSVLYNYGGMVMISPASTVPSLTRKGSRLIFRNVPTDREIGRQLANYAAKRGYRQMVIYYARNEYGLELSSSFEKQALFNGIKSVDRKSYDPDGGRVLFQNDLETWKNYYHFDAVFLGGHVPEAAEIIVMMREMGIRVPIIGGDGLDTPQLIEIAGKAAEGVVFATPFHWMDNDPESQQFTRMYRKKYGTPPDGNPARGYDAIKLLALAITQAGSTVPDQVADALRSIKDWHGATGVHTFDKNGDVVGKKIDIVEVGRDGQIHFEY
jgi:branched-chain amino acid transport system substrate-binding protein